VCESRCLVIPLFEIFLLSVPSFLKSCLLFLFPIFPFCCSSFYFSVIHPPPPFFPKSSLISHSPGFPTGVTPPELYLFLPPIVLFLQLPLDDFYQHLPPLRFAAEKHPPSLHTSPLDFAHFPPYFCWCLVFLGPFFLFLPVGAVLLTVLPPFISNEIYFFFLFPLEWSRNPHPSLHFKGDYQVM